MSAFVSNFSLRIGNHENDKDDDQVDSNLEHVMNGAIVGWGIDGLSTRVNH